MFYERSDETLVLLTLAGDSGAYEELVKKYEHAVYLSALSVTHSHHMAEDAAQDAFVSAWMKLNTLTEPSKYGAWVSQIAKNCAKNMLSRFYAFMPLETVESMSITAGASDEPEEELIASENRKELRETVAKLPKRVREVIELHYFSDLSTEMIARKMGITIGTVKSQLFEGRRRIRKELSAMNENVDDTITEKVMKKVEELKLWQLYNDKTGFEKVYNEVLSEVEALPESEKKHHAMADVLLRGYWWIPGKMNDALLGRIKEYALLGGNDEAMIYIINKEDNKLYGYDRMNFMRDVQIPMLEKAGLSGALSHEWFWLAHSYFEEDEVEKGKEAYLNAEKAGKKDDPFKYLAPAGLRTEEKTLGKYKDKQKMLFNTNAFLTELRYVNGVPRRYGNGHDLYNGWYSTFLGSDLWYILSQSDGKFYEESLKIGEKVEGSDGTVMLRTADQNVETPAGVFDNCLCFETKITNTGTSYRVFYKEDVGAVRIERRSLGTTDAALLASYSIVGGKGLLPIFPGNRWEYVGERSPEFEESVWTCEAVFDDGNKAYILTEHETERKKFDENSWEEMVRQIRCEYFKESGKWDERIQDVSYPISRAETLAVTPVQKAITKAAASVARRIMETDREFNPLRKAAGIWNFFDYGSVYSKGGKIFTDAIDRKFAFEWKCTDGDSDEVVLYNDIYGIFTDCSGCIWNDAWKDGFSEECSFERFGGAANTILSVSDGGKVDTESGAFDKTIKITLETGGFETGWDYRGVKKEYWFAEGIGIVKAVFCLKDSRKATYELSEYEGTGEGYFPYTDGMRRFYRAVDLTDGYIASADYTYVDVDGEIVIFSDRCGIREIGPAITQYSFIDGEERVDRLWDEEKWDEARQQFDVNSVNIFTHLICRSGSCLHGREDKASEWGKERLKIIETFTQNGEIPPAWKGMYARMIFYASCPTLGMRLIDGRSLDEGFEMLFRAFDLYEEWLQIPDGTELDTGNELIFGGIKLYKGKEYMKLPDGNFAPLSYARSFNVDPSVPYYGLTAKQGWEWFNPAKDDPRYEKAIERAREIKEKYDK